MNPDDFQISGQYSYRSRSPRKNNTHPVFTIHHPQDPAFTAKVHNSGGYSYQWSVYGRVGTHQYGSESRKRKAMWRAIAALNTAYQRCQPK